MRVLVLYWIVLLDDDGEPFAFVRGPLIDRPSKSEVEEACANCHAGWRRGVATQAVEVKAAP